MPNQSHSTSAISGFTSRVRGQKVIWMSQNIITRPPGARLIIRLPRLDLAKRNLRKTKLLSPYDGTIAWRSVQPNEEVQVGQKVFEINATGKMEVQLAVPETTIDRIHIDDAATITFPTLPGESTKGRISYIGSAAVEANAFPVKVELIDPNKKVKPGMTAEANLIVKDENRKPGYTASAPGNPACPGSEPGVCLCV